jgi:hypothetical protein
MLLRNKARLPGRHELFVSAKTRTAVPAGHHLVRDALAQASLDPQVRCIEYVPSAQVAAETVAVGAIVLVRDDGVYHLDVVPARPVRTIREGELAARAVEAMGLRPLRLTEIEIMGEPRYTNSREVWSHAGISVPVGLRMQVLTVLSEDGPMSLGRLLSSLRNGTDPAACIMSMACANLLELDLVSGPLGPKTIARSRV